MVLLEHISKEGTADEKGFSNTFIVHSVAAVSMVDRVTRDRQDSSQNKQKDQPKNFSQFLAKATEEQKQATGSFSTMTYDRNCMVRFFTYQPVKYRC